MLGNTNPTRKRGQQDRNFLNRPRLRVGLVRTGNDRNFPKMKQ